MQGRSMRLRRVIRLGPLLELHLLLSSKDCLLLLVQKVGSAVIIKLIVTGGRRHPLLYSFTGHLVVGEHVSVGILHDDRRLTQVKLLV